jgi:hypothetical protein
MRLEQSIDKTCRRPPSPFLRKTSTDWSRKLAAECLRNQPYVNTDGESIGTSELYPSAGRHMVNDAEKILVTDIGVSVQDRLPISGFFLRYTDRPEEF